MVFSSSSFAIARNRIFRAMDRGGFNSYRANESYAICRGTTIFFFLTNRARAVSSANRGGSNNSILIVVGCQSVGRFFRAFLSFRAAQDKSIFRVSATRSKDCVFRDLGSLFNILNIRASQCDIGVSGFFRWCAFSFRSQRDNVEASVSGTRGNTSIKGGNGHINFPNMYMNDDFVFHGCFT